MARVTGFQQTSARLEVSSSRCQWEPKRAETCSSSHSLDLGCARHCWRSMWILQLYRGSKKSTKKPHGRKRHWGQLHIRTLVLAWGTLSSTLEEKEFSGRLSMKYYKCWTSWWRQSTESVEHLGCCEKSLLHYPTSLQKLLWDHQSVPKGLGVKCTCVLTGPTSQPTYALPLAPDLSCMHRGVHQVMPGISSYKCTRTFPPTHSSPPSKNLSFSSRDGAFTHHLSVSTGNVGLQIPPKVRWLFLPMSCVA